LRPGGATSLYTERRGVVQPDGVHWHMDNLSVHDESIFPASIGFNPQLSIYGMAHRLAPELARPPGAHDVKLA
jgi:choline dehydrogenase-like flavoprotein